MPPATTLRRAISCTNCGRRLILVPGDNATACQDRGACNARRQATHEIAPAADAEVSPSEGEEEISPGSAPDIARQQRSLALRAGALTSLTMDKIQDALENGVQVTLKDGSISQQEVQPMALASILRELRPTLHEPVRAHEAKTTIDRPLIQINLQNPDEVRDAVVALRSRRERQLDAQRPMRSLPVAIPMPSTETKPE